MTIVLSPVSTAKDFTTFDAFLGDQGLFFYKDGENDTHTIPKEKDSVVAPSNVNELTLQTGALFAQGEFYGGMGQVFADRRSSEPDKFLFSEGFDVSKGTLRHHKRWAEVHATKGFTRLAVANSLLFGALGGDTNVYYTSDLTSWTTEASGVSGGSVSGMTSNGLDLYVSHSAGIRKRVPTPTWSDELSSGFTVTEILFSHGRLIYFDSANRVIYEKVPGAAATAIETLPVNHSVEAFWSNGRFIYAAIRASGGSRGYVRHYGLNSGATAIEPKGTTELPIGSQPYSGFAYIGQTAVGVSEEEESGRSRSMLLLGTPDTNGFLEYSVVARALNGDPAGGTDSKVDSMTSTTDTLYFPWHTGPDDPYTGEGVRLASYNLATGAFVLLPEIGATLSSTTSAIANYKGRIVYGDEALAKTYALSATLYQATSTYISSIGDGGAPAVMKLWTKFRLRCKSLPSGSSVAVYYTTKHPEENSWVLLGTYSTANGTGTIYEMQGVSSRALAIKLVSTSVSGGASAPEIEGWDVTFYPTDESAADAEVELIRTIRILGRDRKDRRGRAIYQNPRTVNSAIWAEKDAAITWYEPDATYDVRIDDIRKVTPNSPIYDATGGDASKEAVVLQLRMRGTIQ